MLNEAVSKRLKELRAGLKLSQAKLAAKFGVAQSLIARYETGEHLPPLELLIKYADFIAKCCKDIDILHQICYNTITETDKAFPIVK